MATVLSEPVVPTSKAKLSVSYTHQSGVEGYRLNVRKHYPVKDKKNGFNSTFVSMTHDGMMFPSKEAANAFALSRGYLQHFYRKHSRHIFSSFRQPIYALEK